MGTVTSSDELCPQLTFHYGGILHTLYFRANNGGSTMNEVLQKALKLYRKESREIAELRQMRKKVSSLKNPDARLLAAIDAEIKRLSPE